MVTLTIQNGNIFAKTTLLTLTNTADSTLVQSSLTLTDLTVKPADKAEVTGSIIMTVAYDVTVNNCRFLSLNAKDNILSFSDSKTADRAYTLTVTDSVLLSANTTGTDATGSVLRLDTNTAKKGTVTVTARNSRFLGMRTPVSIVTGDTPMITFTGEGCTVANLRTASTANQAVAFYIARKATLTLTDCTVQGYSGVLYINHGYANPTIVMNNCSVSTHANGGSTLKDGTATGSMLFLRNNGQTLKYTPKVTVTGGVYDLAGATYLFDPVYNKTVSLTIGENTYFTALPEQQVNVGGTNYNQYTLASGMEKQTVTLTKPVTLYGMNAAGTEVTETPRNLSITVKVGEPAFENITLMKNPGGAKGTVTLFFDDCKTATMNVVKEQMIQKDLCASLALIVGNPSYFSLYNPTTATYDQANIVTLKTFLDTGRFSVSSHSMTHGFWGMSNEGGTYEYGSKTVTIPAGTIETAVKGSADVLKEALEKDFLTWTRVGLNSTVKQDGVTLGNASDVPDVQKFVKENYMAARGKNGGINDIATMDLYNIKRDILQDSQGLDAWKGYLTDAMNEGGWRVFVMHQLVTAGDGINLSKTDAEALFSYIAEQRAQNNLACMTFDDMVKYTYEYRSAKITQSRTAEGIVFSVDDGLDNAVYNQKLTLRIPLADTVAETVTLTNGTTEETLTVQSENGTRYVTVELLPDGTVYTVTCP